MNSERFAIRLEVRVRPCSESDLASLEWWGWYSSQRNCIRDAFERHRSGRGLVLVAESQGFPVGQIWADFDRYAREPVAFLWGVRIIPGLRGAGIGRRLLAAAEKASASRGMTWVEISVEKDNPRARALYERLGYTLAGEYRDGLHDQWVLRKRIAGETPGKAAA